MSAPRYFPLPLSTLKHTPHSGLQAFTPPLSHLEGHVLRAMAAARDPTLCPIWKAAGGRGREGMSRNKLDNLPPSSLRLRERGAECSSRSRPSYAAPQGEGFAHPSNQILPTQTFFCVSAPLPGPQHPHWDSRAHRKDLVAGEEQRTRLPGLRA